MHPLDGAFLKIKRATYHLDTLQQAVQEWRDLHPYKVIGSLITEGKMRKYLVSVKEHIPLPSEFSLIIGDVCNNARAALDQTLWQLCLLTNPAFDGDV